MTTTEKELGNEIATALNQMDTDSSLQVLASYMVMAAKKDIGKVIADIGKEGTK